MKRVLLAIICLYLPTICFSQWLNTGNNTTTGTLHIGSSGATTEKLRLSTTGSQRAFAAMSASGTGDAGLIFDASNGDFAGLDYGGLIQRDADLSLELVNFGSNPIHFKTSSTTRMSILGNGFVGIGTDNPLTFLDVRSPDNSGLMATFLSDAGITDGAEQHQWTIRMGRSFDFPNRTLDFGMISGNFGQDPAFFIAPKGNEVFRVTEHGSVGIGTDNPDEKLHLIGTASISGNIGLTSDLAWMTGQHTLELQNEDAGDVVLALHRKGHSAANIRHNATGGLTLNGSGSNTANHLFISGTGKVGVGSKDFGSHQFVVEGSVGARKVVVQPTSGWADFVFDDNYDLISLEDVATFIETHQHLPEIPSEAEVKENGIDVGAMDAKLLQKIEELTLYLIEQNKEIKALKEKVEKLEGK